jgi:hypothetical protein
MWYKDILDTDGNPTGEKKLLKKYAEASRNYSGEHRYQSYWWCYKL